MGFASGFQVGAQAVERGLKMREEEQERRKMEAIQNATPTEMQGYTPAQGAQMEGLARSGGYDIVPQYAAPAEGQTQGLFTGYQAVPKANLQDQASWDMPAAAQTIAPQRVTEFLGQRYEGGLAPDRAEALRTRAMAGAVTDPRLRQQMLLAVTGEERAQANEARQAEGFKTSQEAAGLQIRRGKREEDTENKIIDVDRQVGDFMTKRLTDAEGNMRAAGTDDMIAQIQHRASLLQQGGLGRQATDALKEWQGVAANAIQLSTLQRNEDLGRAAAALGAGDFKPVQAFYDKHVLDGAKTTNITQNKDGSLTVTRVRDDGVPLPDTKVKSTGALLSTLNSFKDPMALYNFSQQEFKNNLAARQVAATESSAASSKKLVDARIENLAARTQGLQTPPLTEAQVTGRARMMVNNREKNPNTNKPFTTAEAVEFLKSGGRDPVMDALNKALGGDTDPFE